MGTGSQAEDDDGTQQYYEHCNTIQSQPAGVHQIHPECLSKTGNKVSAYEVKDPTVVHEAQISA
jgi:hypothetical protein